MLDVHYLHPLAKAYIGEYKSNQYVTVVGKNVLCSRGVSLLLLDLPFEKILYHPYPTNACIPRRIRGEGGVEK